MAVAAFKSKTKRDCDISLPDSDAASFSISSSKRSHRRIKSFTDSSCLYLSDSSSSSGYKIRPYSQHPSSDTESDGGVFGDHPKVGHGMTLLHCEPRYMAPLQRQIDEMHRCQSASSSSINKLRRSSSFKDLSQISKQSVLTDANRRHGNLSKGRHDIAQSQYEPRYMSRSQQQIDEARGYESSYSSSHSEYRQSSSYKDLSETSIRSTATYGGTLDNKQASEDHSEIQEVEERTIRAVHAQTKTFERDPPAGDSSGVGLYEMMRAEIQRAVEDLKEFQESLVGRIKNSQTSEGQFENGGRPTLDKLHEDAPTTPNNHAARLLQSHQNGRELQSKLEDGQKSADSVRLPGNSCLEPVSTRPRRNRRGTDRQMVSKSLDEDARKYFEERVVILKLENLEAEESFSDGPSFAGLQENVGILSKENAVEKSHDEFTPKQHSVKCFPTEEEAETVKTRAVNVDGVVMPWLDWDPDLDTDLIRSKHENSQLEIQELTGVSDMSGIDESLWKILHEHGRAEERCQLSPMALIQRPNFLCHGTQVSHSQALESHSDMVAATSDCVRKSDFNSSKMECSPFIKEATSFYSQHMNGSWDCPAGSSNILISDTILCHRNSFRSRIAQGRLVLCGQKL